jgi:Tfp pilus assembly protein PilV
MIRTLRSERGLSLTELVVVGVLATLVMVGLVGFYINSQATWVDGSTQAQAQREATMLIETMADSIRNSGTALVTDSPDATHSMLHLYRHGESNEKFYFWWDPGDSTVHSGTKTNPSGDHGPVFTTKVDQFELVTIGTTMVELRLLKLRTADGQVIRTATRFALYNR